MLTIWVNEGLKLKRKLVVLDPAFNHRVVLVDGDLLGLTEVGNLYVSQRDAFRRFRIAFLNITRVRWLSRNEDILLVRLTASAHVRQSSH